MKLIELLIGVFILGFMLVSSTSIFGLIKDKFTYYQSQTTKISNTISIFNYSNSLLSLLTGASSGQLTFLNFSGVKYNCGLITGYYFFENSLYSGIICKIDYNGNSIYNYKIFGIGEKCIGNKPLNSKDNSLLKSYDKFWNYNTNSGTCTFICTGGYSWNGINCDN